MNKETLAQIYNALNQIEVKGFENMNRLFGVMLLIRQELQKEENGETEAQE